MLSNPNDSFKTIRVYERMLSVNKLDQKKTKLFLIDTPNLWRVFLFWLLHFKTNYNINVLLNFKCISMHVNFSKHANIIKRKY